MPILHVDLREGFDRDTVVVRVDGREIYRRAGVATNYSIGLADRIPVDVPEGEVRVEMLLPERRVHQSLTHRMKGPATLSFALAPSGEPMPPEVESSPRQL